MSSVKEPIATSTQSNWEFLRTFAGLLARLRNSSWTPIGLVKTAILVVVEGPCSKIKMECLKTKQT
jgi:hypothetical protein